MRSSERRYVEARDAARPRVRPVRDRGSVTAEAAVAVPALVVFAMALVWALMAASAQIQCVDAARAGARAAARSEPRAAALAAARSAARAARGSAGADGGPVAGAGRGAGPGAGRAGPDAERGGGGPGRGHGGRAVRTAGGPGQPTGGRAASRRPGGRPGGSRPAPGGGGRGSAVVDRDRAGSATVWAAMATTVLCAVLRGRAAPWARRSWPATGRAGRRPGGLAAADHALRRRRPRPARGRPRWPRAQGAPVVRCAVRGEIADVTAQARLRPVRARTVRSRAGPPGGRRSGRPAPAGAARSSSVSRRTAPRLCSGSLPLPHLGDWMQDGQPASHSQEAMASRVAVSQSRAVWKARSAKPAPPGWPS